ncbi:MAG: hypothetical protein M3Q56_11240 [Bacteroidota bacterium]|nr:hypothetical protein [Bacteroidota bacterium]
MKKLLILLVAFSCIVSMQSCKEKAAQSHADSKNHPEGAHVHNHDHACPMHPEVEGHEGETCPKCGMKLEPKVQKQDGVKYEMTLQNSELKVKENVELSLTPKIIGKEQTPVPLDVQHEKKIHLIITNEDLSYFDHVHPEYSEDGSYKLSHAFPHGGTFFLYADFKPTGAAHQLTRLELVIPGKSPKVPVTNSEMLTKKVGQFQISLKPDEARFVAGKDIHFDGAFKKNNKPFDVNELENYLGAKAHMVSIHLETKEYIHLHPEVENSNLHFHTKFPKSGYYKTWLQFQDEGKLLIADFIINANN